MQDLQPLKRIVLMEDNPSDIFLLRRALDEHSVACSLEVIGDGGQALAIHWTMWRRGANPSPDLLIRRPQPSTARRNRGAANGAVSSMPSVMSR